MFEETLWGMTVLSSMSPAPTERIWFKDPFGLFADDRLVHFVPERNTTLAVQLNALMRFALYSSVVMILFRHYSLAVYIPVGVAVLTYAMYMSNLNDRASEDRARAMSQEGMTREGEVCTVPTKSNPFMNVMMQDYTQDPSRPPACNISSAATLKQAESLFDDNLYRDVDDVFGRRTSSHAFHSMPNTQIPNDQGAFAQWCYGTGPTFKEGGLATWTLQTEMAGGNTNFT